MNNVREYRLREQMTQADLTTAAGLSQTTVAYADSGMSKVSERTMREIARALKVDVEDLFPKDRKQEENDE